MIVGEMMDLNITMDRVRAMNPQMPEGRLQMIGSHLAKHHIGAEDLARIAKVAGAAKVVSVHFPPGIATPDAAEGYVRRFNAVCDAELHIGQDLAEY